MKKYKTILLSILLVISVSCGYYYFYTGFWSSNIFSYKVNNILNWLVGPLELLIVAVIISFIMMIKDKKVILPILLVVLGVIFRYIFVVIYTLVVSPLLPVTGMHYAELAFDPLLILLDLVFKTAIIIYPALIIYYLCSMFKRKNVTNG